MQLFLFGPGYAGMTLARRLAAKGWSIAATARNQAARDELSAARAEPVDPADPQAMELALARSDAALITAPPDEQGCPAVVPVAAALAQAGRRPDWFGYLSSTGVYGDRGGGWVREDSALAAQSTSGARRVAAERDWSDLAQRESLKLDIFRLPGIYRPGRSAFDRLRDGSAHRIVRPGQVFSRVHVDDLAAAIEASITHAGPGGVYNICDDEPCPPQDVIACAAALMGSQAPPEIPYDAATVPEASRRFFSENKRVANAKAKASLGWRPAYPTYREGLRAILAAKL